MRSVPVLLIAAGLCYGQSSTAWRFWDSSDGFEEAYASSVAVGSGGGIWVKHGAVTRMELLDGYSGRSFPDPGGIGRVECAPDGSLWIWIGHELKRFADGRWTTYYVPKVTDTGTLRTDSVESWAFTSRTAPFQQARLSLVPVDRNRVLIMLPDRILEFNAASGSARTVFSLDRTPLRKFSTLRGGSAGSLLLAGMGGAGRLSKDGAGSWRWRPFPVPPTPYVDFEEPAEWLEGGLLLTGITAGSGTAALGFDGRRWRELRKGTSRSLRAWPGAARSVWIQDGDHVLELAAGRAATAERNGALSGILLSVSPETSGRFWITSSQGLAHYMPPLWQTPPESPPIDDVVSGITEDPSGRIWFLAAHDLICLDGALWSSYPLPKGNTTWAILTEGLAVLKDGRIAIRTTESNILIFDPRSRAFGKLNHPLGRRLRLFAPRPDGKLLVETFAAGSHNDGALEAFDGKTFTPLLKPPKPWEGNELRTLLIGKDGNLWAGGTNFFGRLKGSKFRPFGPADGFFDGAGYSAHQTPKGEIIVGGRDGLYRFEGEKWRRFQSGLDRVRSMMTSRDGNLWVASSNGVHRYRDSIWLSNGSEEGLPSTVAYKVFQDSTGRIWAGTTRGLSLFHPEADSEAPIALLAVNQNPREAPPGGQVRLVFSGIDKWKYTLPTRLLFSYRMDGREWSAFAPANSASFEKLKAGKHRFEVRAMDRNGNIGAEAAVHQFAVLLPWFSTPGFRWTSAASALTIAVLLTLAFVSYSHRGRLILELHRKGRLERESQAVLRMIAAREPLPATLERIAAAVAGECAGSSCAVVRDTGKSIEYFSAGMRAPLLPALDRLGGGERAATDWWPALCSLARDNGNGECNVAPVRSGGSDLLGAVALFMSGNNRISIGQAWLETFSDLAAAAMENASLYERLRHQARHDALTGLPNRHYFEERLNASVNDARTNGASLALFYIDLDRFKQINDTLGHRIGDLFLKRVSERLAGSLGNGEVLARIGGDEFTVLVESAPDRPETERRAANMLVALRSSIPVEDYQLFASASIGISFFPEDGETPSMLQRHADAAMYRAKAAGRNRAVSFSAEMMSTTAEISIEQMLRRALEENLFELHYQPQFTLTGDLSGFEALLRVRDEDGIFVSPAEFIPVAEETGLIVRIGDWVLREACRQIREWIDEGLPPVKIAINVSALQIARASFTEEVAAALLESGIDPRLLELELTETAIMSNLAESKRQMEALRALGIGMAIDDFGTGYSSLSYLQNLPVNVLKIDKSFIHAITGPTGGLPMVQAILALARNLGLTVVAEGVETESQLTALRDSRCDFLQGFLFCRPQPAFQARAHLTGSLEQAKERHAYAEMA